MVSVGPLDKVVSISGGGGYVGSCAKVVDAAAVGSASGSVVRSNVDGVCIWGEKG